jgi:hypothetical protein
LLPALGRVFSEVSDFDEAWNSKRTSISPLAHSLSSAALPLKVRLLLLLLLGLQRAMSLAAKKDRGAVARCCARCEIVPAREQCPTTACCERKGKASDFLQPLSIRLPTTRIANGGLNKAMASRHRQEPAGVLECIPQPVLSPGRALESGLNAGLALPVSILLPTADCRQVNRTPTGH